VLSVPRRYGKIRRKMGSRMSGMTAHEWQVFTVVYSRLLLEDILPLPYYEMWEEWVTVTTILSQFVISTEDLKRVDAQLVAFADAFTELFGERNWVPNMHMMFHITDDIRRFGPAFVYHYFGFERFNGSLGKIQSDNRAPEKTLMRRLRQLQRFRNLPERPDLKLTDEQREF
jgi:hypothetical protein